MVESEPSSLNLTARLSRLSSVRMLEGRAMLVLAFLGTSA